MTEPLCSTCGKPIGDVLTSSTHDNCLDQPAEWTVAVSDYFPSGDTYDVEQDGKAIARVWDKSNVPVITAAPDLYRALHALRHGRLPGEDTAMLPADIAALVDAALAKVPAP